MANHNDYPIIRFQPRVGDAGRTTGGGGNKDPKWVLTGKALTERSQTLTQAVDDVTEGWAAHDQDGLPHVLSVRFIDEAVAKTHQQTIAALFAVGNNSGQIGVDGTNKMMVKVDAVDQLIRVKQELHDTERNRQPISAITEITPFVPEVRPPAPGILYKLSPMLYRDQKADEHALRYIEAQLKKKQIDYHQVKYGPTLQVFEVVDATPDALSFFRKLPIRLSEPLERAVPPFFRNVNNHFDQIQPLSPVDGVDYPVIGLLDTGVEQNRFTKGWVTRTTATAYVDADLNTQHGTFIATLLLYGDQANHTQDASLEGCRIIDVPVFPKQGVDGPTLLDNIERGIKAHPQVRIWNLSISLTGVIRTDRFSEFAMMLDALQDRYGVVICKSAGNDTGFYAGHAAGPLNIGAEALRAVTVGAIDRNSDSVGYCRPFYPAPYSRVGRGPADTIKPDLVQFGGDVFAKVQDPRMPADFSVVGETALADELTTTTKVGTSFSTPKVARELAELEVLTNHQYTLRTVKALAIHSASYQEVPALSTEERVQKMGYGRPEKAIDIIQDTRYSSTLILEGELAKGQRIDMMEFPFPSALIHDGFYYGQIHLTVVTDPILRVGEDAMYCQSELTVQFGTYTKKKESSLHMARYNPFGREGATNILRHDYYSQKAMAENDQFVGERVLLAYGQKYYPVKKFSLDLADLKPATIQHAMSKDNTWFLFLETHYRNEAESTEQSLKLPYSVVITIEDPTQTTDVYDSTVNRLNELDFIHDTLRQNNAIRLEN
ncbi:S8 family peptidase [Schleiferilactobacillus shenzhenensis]|uniref:Peptidase S8/S53 domain-containing protein n=1 Tax=Schleiferilactobacillus shenzhenensis LY-73 TaxID=1231336 RepID=U4TPT5_9LACO|nr:S8 family peptidase [Schleiferilactobacillus shenzhenensis]ERL63893.1 hypothetical protein L248_1834 [Schleiferilactobacillus shenzhenensis LY-73]